MASFDNIPTGNNSEFARGGTNGGSAGHPAPRPILRQTCGSFGRDKPDSTGHAEFGSNNHDEFGGTGTGKVSMGDKLRGGAKKLAGKMTGNPGL
ncbi:hypothetical protein FB451DRAFT_1556916 [Mycena latifolia]|nr:hypothetical protein FB451DRAFT_1556916 [Mycena latifolia]